VAADQRVTLGGQVRRPLLVPRRRRPRIARPAIALALGAATLVLGASPAAADPPRPTDFRSTVTAVAPDADAVDARVVGGDAFLELEVADGHEVVVRGYGDEPYLRFRPDGTVERNRHSEATYLNDDRQGSVSLPAEADNTVPPEWDAVAHDGTYAWHDHRIHWMGGSTPPGAERGEVVQRWTVALEVDGTPTEVRGELVMVEDVSPLPWLALAVVAGAAVVLAGRRRPALAATVAVLVAAGAALVAGGGEYAAAPAGSGADPLLVAVPATGLVAAIVALALRRRAGGAAAALAAAAAVLGWCVLRASVLWTPVLPTDLPFALDRAATALALGLAAAAAGLVAWAGGVTGLRATAVELAGTEPDEGPTAATDAGGGRR
jgi:hypothetical protein